METFPKPTALGTLSHIGKVVLYLIDDRATKTLLARIEVTNAGGEVLRSFDSDLRPYLTAGQVNQMEHLLDAMREKAGADML